MQQSLLLIILAGFFVIVVSTRNEAIDTCTDVPLNRGASCEHVDDSTASGHLSAVSLRH